MDMRTPVQPLGSAVLGLRVKWGERSDLLQEKVIVRCLEGSRAKVGFCLGIAKVKAMARTCCYARGCNGRVCSQRSKRTLRSSEHAASHSSRYPPPPPAQPELRSRVAAGLASDGGYCGMRVAQ